MALHKTKTNGGLEPIPQKDFGIDNYEKRLEDLLEKTPQIPDGEDVMFIARQEPTKDPGGIIDLLALNINGDAIIIELKRGTTPKEVIAQALSYASWINRLGYDELNSITQQYFLKNGMSFSDLASVFRKHFASDEDETNIPDTETGQPEIPQLNQNQKIYIIAQEISEEVARVARFLRKSNIDISCIKFTYYTAGKGEEVFETEWVVGQEEMGEVKKETPRGPGKYDNFFQLFQEQLAQILPTGMQPSYFSKHSGRNYKQIRYPGFGSNHYELRCLTRQNSLEVALHRETSQYDGVLKKIFEKNGKAIKEGAGADVVCEPWGKNWERIYKLLPIGEEKLDEKMAAHAAKEMKQLIETINPFTKELLA